MLCYFQKIQNINECVEVFFLNFYILYRRVNLNLSISKKIKKSWHDIKFYMASTKFYYVCLLNDFATALSKEMSKTPKKENMKKLV